MEDYMTLGEFLDTDWTVDFEVFDNVFDWEYPSYCNTYLTAKGKERFKELLSLECVVDIENASITIDIDSKENYEDLHELIEEFFGYMAGECSVAYWNRWFCDDVRY